VKSCIKKDKPDDLYQHDYNTKFHGNLSTDPSVT
jgi:hypothetical protein